MIATVIRVDRTTELPRRFRVLADIPREGTVYVFETQRPVWRIIASPIINADIQSANDGAAYLQNGANDNEQNNDRTTGRISG